MSNLSLINSIYGFKDDDDYDDETAKKGIKGFSKLKREVNDLKFELGVFKDEIREIERYRREYQTFKEEAQTFKDEARESIRDVVRLKSDVAGLNADILGIKRDVGGLKKLVNNDAAELEKHRTEYQTFKDITKKYIIDVRSTLMINDLLASENVITR